MEYFGDRAGLRKKTLILPALSIGNAGQLAVDLLISSYGASKVGYLDDPYVLPCVGNDPFGPQAEGRLAVAVELYADSARNLTLLQQRSPLIKGTTLKHADCLADWARNEGFEQVVILSGLDSGRRQYHDYPAPQVYHLSSSEDAKDKCERLGWKDVQLSLERSTGGRFDFSALRDTINGHSEHDEYYLSKLPVTHLFTSCKERGLKVLSVLCYCAEGDNVPDASFLASAIDSFLHSSEGKECKSWRMPLSWSTVYGAPPDYSIY